MSNSKLSPNFPIKFRWQLVVTGISLLAIAFSILFQVKPILSPELPLLIVIVVGGIPSVIEILLKLFKGDLGADLLAAIALITAVILNEYLAAVFIILMISSGQALEAYAMRKASSVLLALAKRMPSMVHQKIDNRIEDIPLVHVQIGDNIVIYPHETCPVDGIVVEGQGSMDESYLTGEPYQMSKVPGTSVISGAINGETVLTIQAQKLPSESRYASIVSVLEEAEQKKPTLRRLGDKIGAIFAPIALVLAFVTWYMTGDEIRFLAVLVIATPCPLLIAIPITVISAISMAAKQSIIIKDPPVLESLSICRTAIFDKTGTLTSGKPILSEILTKDESDSNFVLQNVASLERYSKHPLAKKAGLPLLNATRITEPQGKGLSGVIGENKVLITSRKKVLETYPELITQLPESALGLECVILINGKYVATLRFRDVPREETKPFITHLKPSHQFNKIMLVSGDRESEVNYLGKLLNLTEIHASKTPEEKLEIVRLEMKKAPT